MNLEKDASGAGVQRVGGLFSTAEIKILICYILNAVNEPVPANMLINELHLEGIANGFEVSDALASLIKSGHIVQSDPTDDTYVVTALGKTTSETLQTSLSYSVKERAYNTTIKLVARFKNDRDSRFNILHEDGKTFIECSALDRNEPFFSIKLLVPDDGQAMHIRERFLNDGANIYASLIEMLTK